MVYIDCFNEENPYTYIGTIRSLIDEPIHFSGPSPGDQSAIIEEEEKKEQPDLPPVTDQDDPKGAAQQRLFEEETKEPELPQTVQPAGGAAKSAPSVDDSPQANQQLIDAI